MTDRQLHLNVNILSSGFFYSSAWRAPASDPFAFANINHYVRVAQIAERGTLDAVFLADIPAINGGKGQINGLKTLKRAMFGRAGIELLRARMLPLN